MQETADSGVTSGSWVMTEAEGLPPKLTKTRVVKGKKFDIFVGGAQLGGRTEEGASF